MQVWERGCWEQEPKQVLWGRSWHHELCHLDTVSLTPGWGDMDP